MNHLVCGSFGSQSEDDDIGRELLSPCSTMRRTLKKNRDRDSNKNPYANRGLDKFYALLAQLEHKKQKIYTQKGSGNISLVRFVYSANSDQSSDDDWKPVVVKVKKKAPARNNNNNNNNNSVSVNNSGPLLLDKYPIDNSGGSVLMSAGEGNINIKEVVGPAGQKKIITRNYEVNGNNNNYWRRLRLSMRSPCVYLPMMIILVLLLLAIYGKAFAIVCTSVGWYLIPMIAATEDVGRSTFQAAPSKGAKKINHLVKKEYVRRFSDKSIIRDGDGSSSPKSVLNGKLSGGKHAHKKSW